MPNNADIAKMTIAEFSRSGRIVSIFSKVLGEKVYLAADNADQFDIDTCGGVVYHAREFGAILGMTETQLKTAYEIRKTFGAGDITV